MTGFFKCFPITTLGKRNMHSFLFLEHLKLFQALDGEQCIRDVVLIIGLHIIRCFFHKTLERVLEMLSVRGQDMGHTHTLSVFTNKEAYSALV